jgi:hypothetical protein
LVGLLFLRIDRALQFVFSLADHPVLLACRERFTWAAPHNIISGLSAVRTGLTQVLNEVYKKVAAPLDPV